MEYARWFIVFHYFFNFRNPSFKKYITRPNEVVSGNSKVTYNKDGMPTCLELFHVQVYWNKVADDTSVPQVSLWIAFMSAASSRVPFSTWSHHLNRKLSTTSLNHGDNFKPSSPASAFLRSSFNSSWLTYLMSATSSGFGFTLTSRTMKSR